MDMKPEIFEYIKLTTILFLNLTKKTICLKEKRVVLINFYFFFIILLTIERFTKLTKFIFINNK